MEYSLPNSMMGDTEKDILRNRKPIFSIDSILSHKLTSTKHVESETTWKIGVSDVRHKEHLPVLSRYKLSDDVECLSRCSCEKCRRDDGYPMTTSHLFDDDLENRCYSSPSYYQGEKSSDGKKCLLITC